MSSFGSVSKSSPDCLPFLNTNAQAKMRCTGKLKLRRQKEIEMTGKFKLC